MAYYGDFTILTHLPVPQKPLSLFENDAKSISSEAISFLVSIIISELERHLMKSALFK